ncbi:bifunctional 2-polyprenyl-6-hydroxyphenol methylase/3-demethylubiquinol 3-O-methyltransferase UbiG [Terrarubrum flagellatum]|uniref:bifunctional 2-polyprenyl-6-hydroxyphenol methylase/3-demethylubiquinol 3-O-methyltransferase UbiG n=1 Tax=Terrirubrum flagellatum TaxID=2895980 RepID=UPI0031455372
MNAAVSPPAASIDPSEVAKFDRMAADWWNPKGSMAPLHKLNPTRLAFIRDAVIKTFGAEAASLTPLAGRRALDIGCGGGLLSEPLARLGARVVGIDPAPTNIAIAKRHAAEAGLAIDYRGESVEDVVAAGERFDLVIASEVVEHVVDVKAFVAACCKAVAPDGLLIMSTLNRTLRSFALAIVGAEYVLRWLPRGTHDWEKFVTPRELADAIAAGGLTASEPAGMVYNPLGDSWRLSRDAGVNYLMSATRA